MTKEILEQQNDTVNRHDADVPLITVVTVALNAATTLRQTIISVLSQDYPQVQYIVIDGGSTDETPAILRRFEMQLDRLVTEPDGGIANAMNKGIRLASGEYVLFIHADDHLVDDNVLSRVAARIATGPNADIYAGCVDLHGKAGRKRICRRWLWHLNVKQAVPHQGALCRRSLFEELGGFDESLAVAMDYEFFLRAYRAGKEIARIDEVICEMSGYGLSSRLDVDSLRSRLAEEQRVHQRHATSVWLKTFYALYWVLYPRYRGWKQFGNMDSLAGVQRTR